MAEESTKPKLDDKSKVVIPEKKEETKNTK